MHTPHSDKVLFKRCNGKKRLGQFRVFRVEGLGSSVDPNSEIPKERWIEGPRPQLKLQTLNPLPKTLNLEATIGVGIIYLYRIS